MLSLFLYISHFSIKINFIKIKSTIFLFSLISSKIDHFNENVQLYWMFFMISLKYVL